MNISIIKSNLDILSHHHNILLNDLKRNQDLKEILKCYEEILLFNNENKNSKEFNNILSKYPKPVSVEPGTIGSFLFGCSQGTYGDISKECSPLCTEEDLNKTNPCDYQIWVQQSDNTFIQKSNTNLSKGFIYVKDDFISFTKDDIIKFKKSSLYLAQVFRTRYGKHYSLIKLTEIDNLPVKVENNSVNFITQLASFNENNNSLSNSEYNLYIFLFLVLIIFILLIFHIKIN